MKINRDMLESLLEKTLEIECIQIELRKQNIDNTLFFSGLGSIFQDTDGSLYLKLYHIPKNVSNKLTLQSKQTVPIKVIPKEQLFSMKAIDIFGNKWTSENISVRYGDINEKHLIIIKGKIESLSNEQKRECIINDPSNNFFLVIPGEYHQLPCNWEETKDGGSVLNTCKLCIQDINIEIKNRESYLTISGECLSGNMDIDFKDRLVEALSILFGKLCLVLYSSFCKNSICTSTINNIPVDAPSHNMYTSPPIVLQNSWPISGASFCEFIEKYLKRFENQHNIFFHYLRRNNRSWRGGIENAGLAISTSIEGIIKNHYSANYEHSSNESKEYIEEVKKQITGIQSSEPKIKQKILTFLGNLPKLRPKDILYRLSEEGKIEKDLVDRWSACRNQSTHADNSIDDIEKLQKYIDNIRKCETLFNSLLLLHIDVKDRWSMESEIQQIVPDREY